MTIDTILIVLFAFTRAGVFRFILNKAHLLNRLLSLEFLAVRVYWLLSINSIYLGLEGQNNLFYLVIAVGEGVLGLSLLVVLSYRCGRDLIKTINSILC